MLGELAAMAFELARNAHARAMLVPTAGEPAAAFTRMATLVTRILALQRRLQPPAAKPRLVADRRDASLPGPGIVARQAAVRARHRAAALRQILKQSMLAAAHSGSKPFDPIELERRLTASEAEPNRSVTDSASAHCRELGIAIQLDTWSEDDLHAAIEAELNRSARPATAAS